MILQNSIALGGSPAPAAYQIERSLRFNSADSANLSWTPSQVGNQRTWTWSGWVKRSKLGTAQIFFSAASSSPNNQTNLGFTSGDALTLDNYNGSTGNATLISSAVYRDVSAWYHVVCAVDTTQATASNRIKIYVNGVQITAFSTATYYPQNDNTYVNSTKAHSIGCVAAFGTSLSDIMVAEVNFIDGQALTPSDFGETSSSTGVWIPKAYTGSYGQNGFYLPFNDNSTVLNLGRNRQTLTADPYFPYTTLLLNGNGTNGAQNNTFLDSSSNNFTITRNGNTTQGTFSPFSQTGWGNYFDGSSYLSVADNTALQLGSSDFTWEGWFYLTANVEQTLIYSCGNNTSYAGMRLSYDNATSKFILLVSTNGTNWSIIGNTFSTTAALNTWHHVAIVRSGTTFTVYQNGSSVYSTTLSGAVFGGTNHYIGAFNATGGGATGWNYFNGYASNVRLVKGTAVYTSNFTPSTTPLTAITNTSLLTCQANRFRDASSNAFTITVNGTPSVQAFSPFAPTAAYSAATNGGSAYFDGTGDYLSLTGGVTNNGTGDLTLEFWSYYTGSYSAEAVAFDSRVSPFTNGFAVTVAATSGNWTMNFASQDILTSTPAAKNAWQHVVVTRSGNTFRLFIDGVLRGTLTSSNNLSNSTNVVGASYNNGSPWFGYLSGMRAIKGSIPAAYQTASTTVGTSVFTPPTAPPTAVASTSALLNFTNAGIIDATGDTVLETAGNAQISTTQSKWGGSSIAFDGTGDYLTFPSSQNITFGTGDFTIEGWIYLANTTGIKAISDQNSGQRMLFYVDGTSLKYYTAGATQITGGTLSANTWTHVAVVRSSSSTKMYVNGVQVGSSYSDTQTYGSGLFVVGSNAAVLGNDPFNGYIDDFRVTKFARYTGSFTVPAAQFAYNTADINVKQWVPNNFSVTAGVNNDSLVDSPTNYGTDTGAGGEVRGNYATLNPLSVGSGVTLSNGNLDFSSGTSNSTARSTFGVSSGKWYWEVTPTTASPTVTIGVTDASTFDNSVYVGSTATSYSYYTANGNKYNNGTGTSYGASIAQNDVVGVALDMDAGTLTFYKNGVSQGTAFTGITGTKQPAISINTASTYTASLNFGQRPFAYTAPSGFKALNTQNLPTPAIGASASTLANKNFNTLLWTGDGSSSNRSFTGVGFAPDLVWVKNRGAGEWHVLSDIVRGGGGNKSLSSNSTNAEGQFGSGNLQSFDADGFTFTAGSGSFPSSIANYNSNSTAYVGWAWKANGAGVSNTAGSITSTVSANQTAGISVVTYTGNNTSGATVGHGLGKAPSMIITKSRSTTAAWTTYHQSVGATKALFLNDTIAAFTSSSYWNNTAPTSSVFSLGSGSSDSNANGATYVAYCFAEIAGFSKFGSYTGNGSTDGPFVYCGFRPRYIMIKRTDSSTNGDWNIRDTARDPYNVTNKVIFANVADSEYSGITPYDILSNGFKLRDTGANVNGSGATYIFAAFAEAPFNYARAR